MDLATQYLGFNLPHPFTAGSSPLVDNLDQVKQLEDAGAAAVVMHSLFEEQIIMHQKGVEAFMESHEESFGEAVTYFPRAAEFNLGPDQYFERIRNLKETVSCPVIASLNGLGEGTWVEYAKQMQEAGADALELNLYFLPTSGEESGAAVEEKCLRIVTLVRQSVTIPVAVKISPFFASLMNFTRQMESAGASALVLFNRFYQPDIDVENLEIKPDLQLSDSSELLLRLRWLAMLHGRLKLDLAVTGGVHTAEDAIKALMAGADCVQLVSLLLKNGPSALKNLREGVETWMEKHEYNSLEQLKGSMSHQRCPNPGALERANYLKILQSWNA